MAAAHRAKLRLAPQTRYCFTDMRLKLQICTKWAPRHPGAFFPLMNEGIQQPAGSCHGEVSWQDVPVQLSEYNTTTGEPEFEFLSMSIETSSRLTRYVHVIVFPRMPIARSSRDSRTSPFLVAKSDASNSELKDWTWNSQMWLSTECFFFAYQTRQISAYIKIYICSRCGSPFTSGLGSSVRAMVRPRAALSRSGDT